MKVTRIDHSGNSAKFLVVAKKGEFTVAISFTLRTKIWMLAGTDQELEVASELAEAIVSRHDPKLPFRKVYVFGEHNVSASADETIAKIRKHGYQVDVKEKK